MDFSDLRKLKDKDVQPGERWIYSAAFDVKPDLKETERIDIEIEDLEQLLSANAKVAILSHQGRFEDNDTIHLDFVAKYLSDKLGRKVKYFPENTGEEAKFFVNSLKDGEAAIMGNVRFNEVESKNDQELSREYTKFGDFVAIGGFTKAHRKNSSNVGILNHKPGYLPRSIIRSMKFLEPWAGESGIESVAIIGGKKKEKITMGFKGFSEIYDTIIPGGIVLNTIFKLMSYNIGDSLVDEYGETFEEDSNQVFSKYREKIFLPEKVCITNTNGVNTRGDFSWINIKKGVPNGYQIVDFNLSSRAKLFLDRAVEDNGRILVAGTPSAYSQGFNSAVLELCPYLEDPKTKSILLGGDTVHEFSPIDENVKKSTGGGSALEYLTNNTLTIIEALKENKSKFK